MTGLFEQAGPATAAAPGLTVAVGVVSNNVDTLMEGKILVRVPALERTLWARLCAPGAGSGAGLFYVPRIDDEVLLAFAGGDVTDAYVLGGLWNRQDSIPVSDPLTALTTRLLASGVTAGAGHEIKLDDLEQTVTITTSTGQKVTMDPAGIVLTNLAGTVKVSLDNASQAVTLQAAASISIKAPKISLEGATVEINGTATATLKSSGVCNVTGTLVKIN
ncbi:hypothetical protein GCM10010112_12840 [Actinoplanes lobatus]|uniref:Uncharacterized protein involved in type VI secretion and phage assembly n=1 Tax=Actinoplanes lobatus TaxID=113568 RepID=A0A7W7MJX4_9ACTN|nr:phage baseplate assembly protein V [Actinoplanes lobatus]MBB4753122.1 uncharacterized protein involved in type VI secretion and phage assembly [Actinoplanes lobatus]GGN58779.1 hypothetical protein GCM10010112_12840 [Actinoplanes lobatus]GIE43018.1 hypothetical protein Alo02nite_59160 [Actinoplanes lobatus]